jgi:hypothetical protein
LWNRFHVDLDDERAGQKIRALIQESAKVFFLHRSFVSSFSFAFSYVDRLWLRKFLNSFTKLLNGGINKVDISSCIDLVHFFSSNFLVRTICIYSELRPAHHQGHGEAHREFLTAPRTIFSLALALTFAA